MTETLTIARVGAQGDGIADTPGGPVFVPLTLPGRGPRVVTSPEGPSDTNGGDRINAHVLGRFLRAL